MGSVQINFSLHTSSNVESVHLVGSWDAYSGQLPLSREKPGKPGSWAGTFRFRPSMVQPGLRYWYYYILDGYHVSHDPAAEYTVESTTKRKLNILDVPSSSGPDRPPPQQQQQQQQHQQHSRSQSSRSMQDVLVVRGPSPSRIQHPRPSKPYASRDLREGNYDYQEELSSRLARSVDIGYSDSDSPSTPGSLTSSRSGSTSPSSLSSVSDSSGRSNCSCRRYGITQSGDRIKLDCGGHRCGIVNGQGARKGEERYASSYGAVTPIEDSTDSASSCSSDSDEEYRQIRTNARRQGITVRR